MYSEKCEYLQRSWAGDGLMAIRRLLPFMKPVGTYPDWKSEERQTISNLLGATARMTESALLLCAYGQLWDAEILTRSVLEGTLKFCYIVQSRKTFDERHREFARDLFDISRGKDHQKATELLAQIPNPEASEWRPIRDMLLSSEDLASLQDIYDRPSRRELETRWGFTGLVGQLSRSGDSLFEKLGAIAHGYSMASHLSHVDMAGASVPMERDLRTAERREAVHLAHEGRLISDLLTFMFWRLQVGYRFVSADLQPIMEAWSIIQESTSKFGDARDRWMHIEYPNVEV